MKIKFSITLDDYDAKLLDNAVRIADIVMVLIPDEEQPATYMRSIVEHLRTGTYLAFAHGFSVHFGTIVPPKDVNVFMVAPKSPGPLVRSEYEKGRGVPHDLNRAYFDLLDREDPTAKIFILTDDASWLETFRQRYGGRIAATDCQRTSGLVGVHSLPIADHG